MRFSGICPAVAFAKVAICLALIQANASYGIEHEKGYGEPYELLGKRIVFTTWYFVRPGQLDWQNAQNKSVYGSGNVKAGPFDSHFTAFDAPSGVTLVAERAERAGPIVARDRAWDKMGISISSVLLDGGKFRAWGTCQDAEGKARACYLESTDGIKWEKPNLGLVEFAGSKQNNLIEFAPRSVFIDPTAPPHLKYKSTQEGDYDAKLFETDYKKRRPSSMMALETDPGRVHSIRAAVSADGLVWKELEHAISVEPSDTLIVAGYDPRLKKYVMFTRSYMIGPRAKSAPLSTERRHQFIGRRAIGRSETDNFEEFPLSQVIIETGSDMPPDDTYYTNSYTTLPGAPDHHVLFPAIYHQSDDTSSIELFGSYDGKVWHRAPGSPLLRTSEFGQWDGGCIFAHPNLIERSDGSWGLVYVGFAYPHKYPRGAWSYDSGMAVWPKGRLMAIQAKERGEFTTIAFLAPGSKLRINAVTERAGSILVEAAGLNGQPMPGRAFADAVPIVGDQYRTPVTWKGANDLGIKVGQPMLLRFRMDKAKIYGLDFE